MEENTAAAFYERKVLLLGAAHHAAQTLRGILDQLTDHEGRAPAVDPSEVEEYEQLAWTAAKMQRRVGEELDATRAMTEVR